MSQISQAIDRRPDLDWIRVGAFALLILYHVGMFYVPWDWHVKSPAPVAALEPVMLLTNPWRLTLLFLVSGAATRFMADKMAPGALARSRTARLLPPLLVAVFVIVPPQTFYEVAEKLPAMAEPYGAFWGKYVTASGGWRVDGEPLITPTWNHMWFVVYLLVYSLVLAAVLKLAGGAVRRLGEGLEGVLSGWRLLVLPILFLAAIRLALAPLFPITHALVDDWYNHALSFSAFGLGFLTAKSMRMRDDFIRLRWVSLALFTAAYAVFAAYAWAYRGEAEPSEGLKAAMRAVYAVDQWAAVAAVLGFGAKHLTRGGPMLRYLTLAVFPFYILHQTLIVVLAHHLAKLGLPQGLEAAVLIAATFGGCFAVYEVVRRVDVLRPLFGLKAQERAAPAAPAFSG